MGQKAIAIRECRCASPNPSVNPRWPERCETCSNWINPRWVCNDQTVKAFYDRLEDALFPYRGKYVKPSSVFKEFRAQAEARERKGRQRFGFSYLTRNNKAEANEEVADFVNYVLFDSLQEIRETGRDDDIDLVLKAARHAFLAYDAVDELKRKRHGHP